MDIVEFYRELRRMCKDCKSTICDDCPMNESPEFCGLAPMEYTDEIVESAIKVVEKWAKDHPVITNAKKFEEVFGVDIGAVEGGVNHMTWWNQEYKEP